MLQKMFTVDFLTKKQKINEGEVPQYYVEGSHQAIIDPDEFEQVQAEMARRKRVGRSYSGDSIYACRIICGECGGYYGPKVWHSNDPYRKVIWRCNRKFKDGQRCGTPTMSEEVIRQLFLEAYNKLLADREKVLADCKLMYDTLADFSTLDDRIRELTDEIKFVSGMSAALIKQHASLAESEEEYEKRRAVLVDRYNQAQSALEQAKEDRQLRIDQQKKIKRFVEMLKKQPLVQSEWDDYLWSRTAESITLHGDKKAEVCFVNGVTISTSFK